MADQKKEPTADIYLFLDGIKGPLAEPGREGWIKVSSAQFGLGCAISTPGRYRRNRTPEQLEAERKKKEEEETEAQAAAERGETEDEAWARQIKASVSCSSPSVSELTLTKETDASSPLLFHHNVLRKPLRKALMEVVREDKSTTRLELDTVFISAFSFSVGRGRASESFSLNYRSLEFGVEDASVRYDITTQQAHFNGELVAPFWDQKKDGDDS
jgi:type VI protein secretion system component Hcp